MSPYVFDLQEVDKSQHLLVGGKGANLGELARIEGIRVPDGFCVSTEAYRQSIGAAAAVDELLDQLSRLTVGDREQIAELSAEIRRVIEAIAVADDIADEIGLHLARLGEDGACAVRSSATAEDLATSSFAGQQDTYLNIVGKQAVLKHIRRCWASLFTERAVSYRIQNGFDHRQVYLAVVVQKMVFPQVAGVLFTADPVTSNRKVLSIDASFGLGEALVAGLVNADRYQVRDGKLIARHVATKTRAVDAAPQGGTEVQEIAPERRNTPALTDAQILRLERVGRTIEAHFGSPQDIEWCLVDDSLYIVQSRPITTLFPIPDANDQASRVYVSVSHGQMMTDAIKPLGLSLFQLTAGRPMVQAGGRLFVDVTPDMASPVRRGAVLNVLGRGDPLIKDALVTILERGDFIQPLAEDATASVPGAGSRGAAPPNYQTQIEYDPAIVPELIRRNEESIEALERNIQTKSGLDLVDFILDDIQTLKKLLTDPGSFAVLMTAMNASAWVNEKMEEWLGEKNVADTLSQSVPNNVTSEMGLALLDVADVIRPHPEVVEYLRHAGDNRAEDDCFLDDLVALEGGPQVRDALSAFLDKYGMRCVGEIDITRARWRERPTTLVPLILSNIRNAEPGASRRKLEQGRQEALAKEQDLLDRLRQLPSGDGKADETKRMIDLIRNYSGYREYPKYGMVSRYFIYKKALLNEAQRLVEAHVIHDKEDIYYLTFEELREVVRTHQLDSHVIIRRKDEHRLYQRLTPPRVITSDGEIVTGAYRREDLPAGALVGIPVSSGVVEGRARVILRLEEADLETGDILVTPYTDPSWTPLFVTIRGLVTEVGGLMTHGAVIAREYGLPAVVGVENATRRIRDGQRIRVHGTEGYVEIL